MENDYTLFDTLLPQHHIESFIKPFVSCPSFQVFIDSAVNVQSSPSSLTIHEPESKVCSRDPHAHKLIQYFICNIGICSG